MSTIPPLRQETYLFPVQQPICELFYDLAPELVSPITEWIAQQNISASDVALLRFSMFMDHTQEWEHCQVYISTVEKHPTLELFQVFETIDINTSPPQEREFLGFVGLFYRWVDANWPVNYRL